MGIKSAHELSNGPRYARYGDKVTRQRNTLYDLLADHRGRLSMRTRRIRVSHQTLKFVLHVSKSLLTTALLSASSEAPGFRPSTRQLWTLFLRRGFKHFFQRVNGFLKGAGIPSKRSPPELLQLASQLPDLLRGFR
eukprot:scaffold3592_cov214-Pinguiococcus_pyrenoidosus.AAC.1